jgi:hypothetical protein
MSEASQAQREPRQVVVLNSGQKRAYRGAVEQTGLVALFPPIPHTKQEQAIKNAGVILQVLGWAGVSVGLAEGGASTNVPTPAADGESVSKELGTVLNVQLAAPEEKDSLTGTAFDELCHRVGSIVDSQVGELPLFDASLSDYDPIPRPEPVTAITAEAHVRVDEPATAAAQL